MVKQLTSEDLKVGYVFVEIETFDKYLILSLNLALWNPKGGYPVITAQNIISGEIKNISYNNFILFFTKPVQPEKPEPIEEKPKNSFKITSIAPITPTPAPAADNKPVFEEKKEIVLPSENTHLNYDNREVPKTPPTQQITDSVNIVEPNNIVKQAVKKTISISVPKFTKDTAPKADQSNTTPALSQKSPYKKSLGGFEKVPTGNLIVPIDNAPAPHDEDTSALEADLPHEKEASEQYLQLIDDKDQLPQGDSVKYFFVSFSHSEGFGNNVYIFHDGKFNSMTVIETIEREQGFKNVAILNFLEMTKQQAIDFMK